MGEILFLAHRVPFPPDRGDKIRSHHILKRLARIAPVHVATFGDDDHDMQGQTAFGGDGGWSWREGAQNHTPAVAPTTPPSGWTSVAPIYDYPHSGTSSPVTVALKPSQTGPVLKQVLRPSRLHA